MVYARRKYNYTRCYKCQKHNKRKVDTKLIMKAYNFAEEKHHNQYRKSGESYIIHPLNVAYILAQIGLDDNTICAALLHDVVEDTDVTNEDIKNNLEKKLLKWLQE